MRALDPDMRTLDPGMRTLDPGELERRRNERQECLSRRAARGPKLRMTRTREVRGGGANVGSSAPYPPPLRPRRAGVWPPLDGLKASTVGPDQCIGRAFV